MSRITAFLASVAVLAVSQAVTPYPTEAEMEAMYDRFQKEHGSHAYNAARRFIAFKKNVKLAIDANAEQNATCTDLFDGEDCVFGITKFSDMFQEEFESSRLGYNRSTESHDAPVLDLEDLRKALNDHPGSVDWRQHNAVTKVKDQGDCGSCWAFSATEEIESAVFMATKRLPVLSTQQIISCDRKHDDHGCNGGDPPIAYKYVERAGGLDSSSDYPDKSHITGKNGKCKKKTKVDAKVTGFSYAVKPCKRGHCKNQDEAGLARALATKGPISICVNAHAWQVYKRGIFSKKCSGAESKLDHCVQLVGYDKTGSTPYWIVRNSWNTDWGIHGYMHLEMGKNLCGVANEATIVHATSAEAPASATSVVV